MNNELNGIGDFFENIFDSIKNALIPKDALQSGATLQQVRELYNYTYNGGVLKRGDTGDKVKTLQYALSILGYHTYNTKYPDGIYGPMTEAAVRDFQMKNGLTPTGVFDKYTAYYLYNKIYNATKLSMFLPTAINNWIVKKAGLMPKENISNKYFTTTQSNGQTYIQPVEHTDWKPILIGGGLILAALLLSGRR